MKQIDYQWNEGINIVTGYKANKRILVKRVKEEQPWFKVSELKRKS